ncbi:hypothetical protein D1007_19522 [Hordeum vulgare]|nr:hypothetical protein D1007_19522 [Hordeum vulgare]
MSSPSPLPSSPSPTALPAGPPPRGTFIMGEFYISQVGRRATTPGQHPVSKNVHLQLEESYTLRKIFIWIGDDFHNIKWVTERQTGLWVNDDLEWFELLGPCRSESRVVNANVVGDTVLYNADEGVILNLPSLNEPKGTSPVCLSVTLPDAEEDALYVMDCYPGRTLARCNTVGPGVRSSFEVLKCSPSSRDLDDGMKGSGWRPLPPPPFIYDHGYEPTRIVSYTVVGDGTTLCISSSEEVPDKALGWDYQDEWRHVGDWELPFHDKAEYFPEFELWFGFSPTRRIAKTISAEATDMRFTALTGIEMVRDKDDQSLQLFKHKSTRYMFTTPDVIHWVI